MNGIMEPIGFKMLGGFPKSFSGCSLNKVPPEPGNPDVPKNMKVRVMPRTECALTYERLGYLPTPIPWAETLTGLQTGIIDGQMGGGLMQSTLVIDVQSVHVKYYDYFEHDHFLVNEEAFNNLPPEYQKILSDVVLEYCIKEYDNLPSMDAKYEQKLRDANWTIIELTPRELESCSTAVRKDVWPKLEKIIGSVIMNDIRGWFED